MFKRSLIIAVVLLGAFLFLGASFSTRPSSPIVEKADDASKLSGKSHAEKVAGPAKKENCITLDIAIEPDSAKPGEQVTLTHTLENICEDTIKIEIVDEVEKDGVLLWSAKTALRIAPESQIVISHTFKVPDKAAAGTTYDVYAAAYLNYANNEIVAEDEATLEIN